NSSKTKEGVMSAAKRCRLLPFILAVVLGSALGLSSARAESADSDPSPEGSNVRKALEKYQDAVAALRDGYFSAVLCVQDESAAGMGIHFLNRTLLGPVPDPMRPPILLYEPVDGKLQLVGAEWFIPLATGVKGRPSLLGQPFDGPMEGHPPT